MTHPSNTYSYIGDKDGDSTGKASGNTVVVDEKKHYTVFGGYSHTKDGLDKTGKANGNTLTIAGASGGFVEFAAGGAAYGKSTGVTTQANDNSVTIQTGAYVSGESGVIGGYSNNGSATGNTITIDGGARRITGGEASNGNATRNTVIISGFAQDVRGGHAYNGNATENGVTIKDGEVHDNWLLGGEVHGTGDATKNTVTISGGEVNVEVIGGWAGAGNATNNTVTLAGGTVKDSVSGGRSAGDQVSGNTLIMDKVKDFSVGKDVSNFETFEFNLPDGIKKDETVLKVSGEANFPAAATTVKITGAPTLNPGERITLIEAANTLTIAPETQTVTVGSLELEVKAEGNKLIAERKGGGSGSLPDAATISNIDGDSGNTTQLQSGKESEVAFEVTAGGAPFNGSGTLSIAKVTKSRALQKASFAGGGTSTTVTIAGGTFSVKITPEEGEKSIDLELAVPDVKDPFKFSLGVAGGGGGGGAVTGTASPVPTMSEIGLLLSGIALAGAAAPALRRREKQGKKADTQR